MPKSLAETTSGWCWAQQCTPSLVMHALASRGWDAEPLNDPALWCDTLGKHRILLLDMDMPDYSGADVLRHIKRYDSKV